MQTLLEKDNIFCPTVAAGNDTERATGESDSFSEIQGRQCTSE